MKFGEISNQFLNLKHITFQNEGFSGSVTKETFEGVRNLETIRFVDTYVTTIEDESFDNLKDMKGNAYDHEIKIHITRVLLLHENNLLFML